MASLCFQKDGRNFCNTSRDSSSKEENREVTARQNPPDSQTTRTKETDDTQRSGRRRTIKINIEEDLFYETKTPTSMNWFLFEAPETISLLVTSCASPSCMRYHIPSPPELFLPLSGRLSAVFTESLNHYPIERDLWPPPSPPLCKCPERRSSQTSAFNLCLPSVILLLLLASK